MLAHALQDNGTIFHRHSEWVKTIDENGRVENYDWGPVYQALRTAAGCSYPGYLWHEVSVLAVPQPCCGVRVVLL